MRPESRIASIRSEVATGRRMNGRDGLMAAPHAWLRSRVSWCVPRRCFAPFAPLIPLAPFVPFALADGRGWLRRAAVIAGLAHGDASAVAQFVGAVDHHLVARREA